MIILCNLKKKANKDPEFCNFEIPKTQKIETFFVIHLIRKPDHT